MSRITFLLSAHSRPQLLWSSLGSLIAQTEQDWTAHVLLNNPDPAQILEHEATVDSIADPRMTLWKTYHAAHPAWDCYWAADTHLQSQNVKSDWICFPSDDSYYTPDFLTKMLSAAQGDSSISLVLCDLLYDGRMGGGRRVILNQQPVVCGVDKTGFIVRRRVWRGFPGKNVDRSAPSECDGRAVQALVDSGVRWAKVNEILCVHN